MKVTQPTPSAYSSYGTGAEARMRLNEIQSSECSFIIDKACFLINNFVLFCVCMGKIGKVDIPIAEGRMRTQERQRHRDNVYSSSLEANMTWRNETNTKTPPAGSPRRPPATNAISKNLAPTKSKNPFEDEIEYDESKNPFAEDEDEVPSVAKEASTNPFDDYDSNLNPFE